MDEHTKQICDELVNDIIIKDEFAKCEDQDAKAELSEVEE